MGTGSDHLRGGLELGYALGVIATKTGIPKTSLHRYLGAHSSTIQDH